MQLRLGDKIEYRLIGDDRRGVRREWRRGTVVAVNDRFCVVRNANYRESFLWVDVELGHAAVRKIAI